MSVSKTEARNILKNLDWAREWAAGNPKCQVRDETGVWRYANTLNQLNFERDPSNFRLKKEHFFERHVVTWTDEKGQVNERIFKGDKRFAEEWAQRNKTYRTFRDTKIHTVRVELDV